MNVANEMNQLCNRLEELVTYAQTKIDRAADRGGKSMGVIQAEKRAAADQEIRDHQNKEAEENLRDQKESFDERNKAVEKTKAEPKKKAAKKKKKS